MAEEMAEDESHSAVGRREAEQVGCRICGGGVTTALTAQERMFGLGGSFEYLECRDCGCLQLKTIPEDLSHYYPDAYYTQQRSGFSRPVPGTNAMLRCWSRFRLRPGRIARLLSGGRYARFDWFRRTSTDLDAAILDVGCGSGRLLERMRRSGFRDLTGIDVNWTGPVTPAPGLRFERASPVEHPGRYRLVMAHHSFEHMRDPAAAFAAICERVEPGGHLLIRVPLADSWARSHYAADWVQLDAPRHLQVPTRRTLEVLARKNGMRIVRVVDDSGPFQIWGSELYRSGGSLVDTDARRRRRASLGARLTARIRAWRIARQGLGDQACFYLQRDPG